MPLNNLKSLIDNLSAFDFMKEQETIVVTNKDRIADLQATQLFTGKDSQGREVELKDNPGGGYSGFTMDIKERKGQPIDRITWRDTGALYRSLTAKVIGGQFTVISSSEKEKYDTMIQRSGENVIGLTETSRFEFAEDVLLPDFKEVLKSKTGLKL